MDLYDVLIIGGGPAGLICAYCLDKSNIRAKLIERGKGYLERLECKDPYDIANGLGGAGLLSDGKFSFSPAGSFLWKELDSDLIRVSYDIFYNTMKTLNIKFPKWNNKWLQEKIYDKIKKYTSIYISPEEQIKLVKHLTNRKKNILINTEIKNIEKKHYGYKITSNDNLIFRSKHIVLANGKYGSNILNNIISSNNFNIKMELGIRVQTDSVAFIPYRSKLIDYKIIQDINENTQIRTFCCCKNGYVIKSYSDGFYSYNGAKSLYETDKSNIGILVRTDDINNIYYKEMSLALQNNFNYNISLDEWLNSNITIIGKNCDKLIKSFLKEIIYLGNQEIGRITRIFGPEVEYIGKYPNFEKKTLKIENENIWIAGDVSGKFRGLTPAFLSGIYIANLIAKGEC